MLLQTGSVSSNAAAKRKGGLSKQETLQSRGSIFTHHLENRKQVGRQLQRNRNLFRSNTLRGGGQTGEEKVELIALRGLSGAMLSIGSS